MLSGFDVEAHGLDWNNWRPTRGYIKVQTIFGEATEHGLKTAMFVGKGKLKHIATPGTVGVYDRPGYLCRKVAEAEVKQKVTETAELLGLTGYLQRRPRELFDGSAHIERNDRAICISSSRRVLMSRVF